MNLKYLFLFWGLIGLAFAPQATAQSAIAKPSFRLRIEKFERRPVTAQDVSEGHDSQIVVVLGYKGTAPTWWSDHSVYSSSMLWGDAKLFYQGDGKSRPVPVGKSFRDEVASWTPVWNPVTRQHEARYLFKLSDLSPSKERIVLRGKISVSDFSRSQIKSNSSRDSAISFSYGVRGSGQTIAPPQISHDPKVDVNRVEIEKLAAPQSAGISNYKRDIIVRLFVRDRNASAPFSQLEPAYPRLVDEKGQQIPLKYNWFPLVSMEESKPPQITTTFSFLLSAIPSTEPNIFMETTWSPHNDWPIYLHIPLRQNGRDLSGLLTSSQYKATPTKER